MIITRKWKDGDTQWTSKIEFCCYRMAEEILDTPKTIRFDIVKFCPWCGDEIIRKDG